MLLVKFIRNKLRKPLQIVSGVFKQRNMQYASDVVYAYPQYYCHSLVVPFIDDIQFFDDKSRTQEEFFYALIEAHKQVITTCDSYLKKISGLEERLVSRSGWGLTVAIDPQELKIHVAILFKKAALDKISLDENVAFFIAKHIRFNVCELEGGKAHWKDSWLKHVYRPPNST